ncbi:fimbrial protein [Cronobacter dublinensis]|uniref:fimbrial protein n=1 Tax=Cronobacter dublinensis TaxID=413497 RepID=UPI0024AFAA0C|nr:fimbrial protein [Cronobacter dublinensis]ELY2907616.1 fimbrial protein [Cronobacter dublinensis]MDI7492825.1 fimbrial protein [Cronobacter dublinensis]
MRYSLLESGIRCPQINIRIGPLLAILLLVPQYIIQQAFAKTGDQYSMNINITGTITANGSCQFSQGEAQQVDFGQVRLQATSAASIQLDSNYQKPIASSFTCSGDSAGLLQMKFISTSGSYATYQGTKVLGTDKGIVGIELIVNGSAQTMDSWFTIDQSSPPTLEAKLVQTSTENTQNVVSGDGFTASGSLVMAFN